MSFFNYYSDPWSDFREVQRQMDRFASRFLQEPRHIDSGSTDPKDHSSGELAQVGTGDLSQALSRWHPHVDVSETDKAITLHAELPGCNKEDIKLSIENNRLVLQGEKKTKKQEKGENWVRRERVEGSFYRAMQLPRGVDASNIQANYINGVLEVVIPKPETAVPKRHVIDIKTTETAETSQPVTDAAKDKGKL